MDLGGCGSRYVVETPAGYVLLERYGGHDPSNGETIVGDLHSYGMKDLYVGSSGDGDPSEDRRLLAQPLPGGGNGPRQMW